MLFLSGTEFNDEDQSFLSTLSTYFGSSISRFDVEPEPVQVYDSTDQQLVYGAAEMQHVLDTADLAAPTDATVLLSGESGTGKEVVARYIYQKGDRHEKPLVVVDCGAVAPSLIAIDLAVPCGLIINELFSNALVHGFARRQHGSGTVEVKLYLLAKECVIFVSDSGRGLPVEVNMQDGSMGFEIISILVEQLEGSFRLIGGEGTTFEVRFPVSQDGTSD